MVDYTWNLFASFSHQETPLHRAADGGHTDTVQCLTEKGADINIKNIAGVSEWDCNAG